MKTKKRYKSLPLPIPCTKVERQKAPKSNATSSLLEPRRKSRSKDCWSSTRVTPVCPIDFGTNGNGIIRGPVPTMSKSYGIYIHVYSRERERERETAFQTTERRLVAYTGPPLNSPFSDEIQSSTYYASVYVCRDF